MSLTKGSLLGRWLGYALGPVLKLIGRRSLPRIEGTVALNGPDRPVEVLRDRWGVPHVFAHGPSDLFFAQGFVHAQDRLFQMEMSRRVSGGRLSDLVGDIALSTDRLVRILGFARLAPRDWALFAPDDRKAVESYVAGVNAFIETRRGSVGLEFDILGLTPEPWSPLDVVAFAKLQCWHLSHSWAAELVRARVVNKVGADRAAEIDVGGADLGPLVLPAGIEIGQLKIKAVVQNGTQGPWAPPPHHGGMGSNSWTVSPERTGTGGALLANDMHLELKLPGIWHLCHLESADGTYRVTGASTPGIPGVLVGHNARIAWGATLAFCDQQDLFAERVTAGAEPRHLFRGEWLPVKVEREEIRVKGRSRPHLEEVLVTGHGPVIGDLVPAVHGIGTPEGQPPQGEAVYNTLSLKAVPLECKPPIPALLALCRAHDWASFTAAVAMMPAPDLNLTYADVDGNIGYYLAGQIPIRARGDGRVPVPGWTGEYEWTGSIPFEEMPHSLNPGRGFVVTANNRQTDAGYRHFLGSCWMNGYRAERIVRTLEATPRIGVAESVRLQMDLLSLSGAALVERLEGSSPESPDALLALKLLRGWDRHLTADSVGGCVFAVLQARLLEEILVKPLGKDLSIDYLGGGINPVVHPASEFSGRASPTILSLLDRPDSWWVKEAGGRAALIGRALERTVQTLTALLGPDPAGWQWGKIHQACWPHPFSQHPVLSVVFDRGPVPIGGDTDTVHQTAYLPQEPYDNLSYSPSFRQVIDLADLRRSRVMIPAGQSGHLASPHYDDLIDPWLEGDQMPMLWERLDVERELEGKLILEPSGRS